MKPLLFLTYSQFKNGVIRAAKSPKRLIGLLFFLGYYFWFFGPAFRLGGRMPASLPPGAAGTLELPPMQMIEALVFVILAVLSLFMLIGVASQQAAFKPADVDVLFPTPISPRIVLLFRIARDYALTLIVPFLILLVGFRPLRFGWESLFRNFPDTAYAGMAFRALNLGWILMAMAWVSLSYATSLAINRSDRRSDWNKRLLSASIFAVVASVGAFLWFSLRQTESLAQAVEVAQHPFLRAVFFTATLAAQMVMAPLNGNWLAGIAGLLGLVGLVAGSLRIALHQSAWMYDQAAVKGFDGAALKEMQKQGDFLSMAAEFARRGKVKARRSRLMDRWKPRGSLALLWKEYFLQTRGMMGLLVSMGLLSVAIVVIPALIPDRAGDGPAVGMVYLMQAAGLMSTTMPFAQVGFIEILRRVDLLKPLPFSMAAVSFVEVAARAILCVGVSLLGSLGIVLVRPGLWEHAVASFVFVVGMSLLMSATVFLVTVLFPDIEDQTQRQFRGLVTFLAIAVLGVFPAAVGAGLWLGLGWPPIVAAAVGSGLATAGAAGVSLVSGKLYEGFNPSE